MSNVETVLQERGNRYGSYSKFAECKEGIQRELTSLPNWHKAPATAKQATLMIVDKIIRAFNGDPNYEDNWIDIQGYAKLAQENTRVKTQDD